MRSPSGSALRPKRAKYNNLADNRGQGADIVRIDQKRPFTETVPRVRFLAEISALYARLALESQVLGPVGIRRGRPFEPGGLGLRELNIHRARQMGDDLVLRLQQIGAEGVN